MLGELERALLEPYLASRAFDPAKHPRIPRGKGGGRFTSSPGAGRGRKEGGPWSRAGDVVTYHNNLGVDRADMPQLSGLDAEGTYHSTAEMMPQFIARLRAQGIHVRQRRVKASSLKPTQTTGDMPAIRSIADELKSGDLADTKPITISMDGRVLDGHHNWAGRVLADAEGGRADLAPGMPVVQVGLPISELMKQARAFGKEHGIGRRGTGVHANPAYAGLKRAFDPRELRDPEGKWTAGGAGAAKSFLDAHYGRWRGSLTPAQDKGLRFYQSPGFALMNGLLRGLDAGKLKASEHASDSDLDRARKATRDLVSAIGAAPPLPHAVTAYRGFDAGQFGKLTVGQVITDKAFTSMALTRDAAPVGRAGKAAVAEIHVPAGTKLAGGSAREMIAPPGSRFRVTSVRPMRWELISGGASRAEAFDPMKHPRIAKGHHGGGQFAHLDGGSSQHPSVEATGAVPSVSDLAQMVGNLQQSFEDERQRMRADHAAEMERVTQQMRFEQSRLVELSKRTEEIATVSDERRQEIIKSIVNVLALVAVGLLTVAVAGMALPPLAVAGVAVGPLLGSETFHAIHAQVRKRRIARRPVSPAVARAVGQAATREQIVAELARLIVKMLGVTLEEAEPVADGLIAQAEAERGPLPAGPVIRGVVMDDEATRAFNPGELRGFHGRWVGGASSAKQSAFSYAGPAGGDGHMRAVMAVADLIGRQPAGQDVATAVRESAKAMYRRDMPTAYRHLDGAVYLDGALTHGQNRPDLEAIRASYAKVPKGAVTGEHAPGVPPELSTQQARLQGKPVPAGVVGSYVARAKTAPAIRAAG